MSAPRVHLTDLTPGEARALWRLADETWAGELDQWTGPEKEAAHRAMQKLGAAKPTTADAVLLTPAQQDGLWSLAEVGRTAFIHDGPDSIGITYTAANAGAKAMDKLKVIG